MKATKQQIDQETSLRVNTLIEEMKSEEVSKRVNSMQNLKTIAQAIGPERTRNELLPYLNEFLEDEDNVLMSLITSLSDNFVPCLGGNSHAICFLRILEQLGSTEDPGIRDKACKFLQEILKMIEIKKNEETLMALAKRLNENSFHGAKQALTTLIPLVLPQLSAQSQNELLEMYLKCAASEQTVVRKYAALTFRDLAAAYPAVTDEQISKIFNALNKDAPDYVRMNLVDALPVLFRSQLMSKNQVLVVQILKQLSEDTYWRIKYYICDQIQILIDAMQRDNFKKIFLGYYLKFLSDSEPELKSIASSKIHLVAAQIEPEEIVLKIIPLVKTLSTDSQAYVRSSLAGSFLCMSSLLGKKVATEQILPLFLQLLKDEDAEVRINLFKKVNEITKVLGVDTLSQSIIPGLTELAADKNWRTRISVIDVISYFAKEIGTEFFSEKIIKIVLELLQDKVYTVRDTTMKCIRDATIHLGGSWAEKNMIPKILPLATVTNYLQRETFLFLIQLVIQYLSQDFISKSILPVITQLSKDPVPNVRMIVVKTLNAAAKYINRDAAIKLIQSLAEDQDLDVQYYSKLAKENLA